MTDLFAFAAKHGAKAARLIAFDQSAETLWSGAPANFNDAARTKLRARGALGASDLGGALQAAGKAAGAGEGPVRVVLFSDGVATLGERSSGKLAAKVTALADAGVVRLDAVTNASARDDAMLTALVGAALPRHGVVARITDHEEHPFDGLALRTFAAKAWRPRADPGSMVVTRVLAFFLLLSFSSIYFFIFFVVAIYFRFWTPPMAQHH